jgi:hypothetical protein
VSKRLVVVGVLPLPLSSDALCDARLVSVYRLCYEWVSGSRPAFSIWRQRCTIGMHRQERVSSMAENVSLLTILCAQCSRHARVRRGDPPPEGWEVHMGQFSCSDMCRETLRAMGLIPED